MLSVILDDVDVRTGRAAENVTDTTYADDTLLASHSIPDLQIYLDVLIEVAAAYGLQPNWKKTAHLNIGHGQDITDSTGKAILVSEQETYLGCLLTANGKATPSLNRRLGEAKTTFRKLQAIWKHANIAKHRKLEIYMACVVSKLMYSLDCECLRAAERRRLDAFHCRSLRAICKIPHSMISHTTNAEVYMAAEIPPLTVLLDERQLKLYGRIASLPDTSMLRSSLFVPGTMVLQSLEGVRARGRPCLTWASVQHARAIETLSNCGMTLEAFFREQPFSSTRWAQLTRFSFTACNGML